MPFFIILLGVWFGTERTEAQPHILSGYVTDAQNGEVLVGANVYDIYSNGGTSTNNYGFFSLTVVSDSVKLQFSYQGYTPLYLALQDSLDELLQIELVPTVVDYDSLMVVEADKIYSPVQMSSVKVSTADVETLPALLGESDLLKVFQLMPGIQSGTEGSTGLYVRGGDPAQTLLMLDGATIYNAGHLFGFMSTFNTDAINSAELIKGGFPARYGGRLSGVLDMTMRDGNRKEFAGRGSAGIVASRVTLEGPIMKKRGSFIVSGRRTYLDLINRLIKATQNSNYIQGYQFYDVNAKLNMDLSNRDRAYLSFYMGSDKGYDRFQEVLDNIDETYNFEIGWSNITATFRWNRILNSRMFANTMLLYSRFRSSILEEFDYTSVGSSSNSSGISRYESGLTDLSAKTDFEYFPHQDHQVRFGGMVTYHLFTPSLQSYQEADTDLRTDTTVVIPLEVPTVEWSTYAEDQITLSSRLRSNVGIHISGYHVEGTTYASVQPRITTSFQLPKQWEFLLSFAQMRQYIQLLSNSGTGLPTDLWLPSTPRTRPQNAWQVASGVAKTIGPQILDISMEVYYKSMDGVVAYKDGSNFVGSSRDWETSITSGRGWSYGAEVLVQRKKGRTTGWIGYTLSWSKRRLSDLNDGRVFPHRYDRRHDFSVVLIREWNRRKISVSWVYSTGHAVTFPASRYKEGGDFVDVFEARNSYRMPAYHRLDISVHLPLRSRRKSELIVSLYNTYNRSNPFYLKSSDYASLDPFTGFNNERRVLRKVTLFPVIPSVSYRFFF